MASVSIITIVKNHAVGLEATYQSLLRQTFSEWEMVIVVGVSSDPTLSIAKDLQQTDSRILLVEQSGLGIYEAMNEGLSTASGDFIWFMNAGDRFASPSVLNSAIDFMSQSKIGTVIGGYRIEGSSQNKTYSFSPRNITSFRFAFNRHGGCHQAMLFRTNTLKALGGFDPSYTLAADFDLVLKVVRMSKVSRVSEVYALIEPGGRADQGIFLVHTQKHRIRRNVLGGPIVFFASVLWTVLARLKIISRRAVLKLIRK